MAAIVLSGATALAGGRHFFGPQAELHRRGTWEGLPPPARSAGPVAFYPVYLWVPVPVVYVLPAPPQTVAVEQEALSEPAPVVVVVQQAPVEPPAPEPPPPAAVTPPPPPAATPPPATPPPAPAPRTPGPDIYHWTDADGVEQYSTRVPPSARGKAKKVRSLSR